MNRILVNDYYITIIASPDDEAFMHFLSFAKNNNVLVDKQRTRDTYRVSLRSLPEVLSFFRPQLSPNNMPASFSDILAYELKRREQTQYLLENGPQRPHAFLWPHQELGVELAEVNNRYAFFYDTRTGKTLMTYQIIKNALQAGKIKRAVVICPSAIISSWKADNLKFFPELKVCTYYGTEKMRREALNTPCHVLIFSLDLVRDNLDLLKRMNFGMAIVDESSKVKSYRTQISECILDYSGTVPYWYILSATPAPNGMYEYYVQMKTIDRYIFSDKVTHFETLYFIDYSRDKHYKRLSVNPCMEDALLSLIKQYAIYVDQSVMPVANKNWEVWTFYMPVDMQLLYKQMCSDMLLEVQGTEITADMAAALRSKLSQLSSGFIIDTAARQQNAIRHKLHETTDCEQETYILNDFRVKELQKRLECFEPTEKIVIWANFHAEFDMLRDALGDSARYINHGVSTVMKEQYVDEFRNNPEVKYLVCHPMSIGMGVNFTVSHNVIYYSMTDSYEQLKQSSERVVAHKSIQKYDCNFYVMLANSTVDAKIYDNVTRKKNASAGVLEFLEVYNA